MLTSRTFATYAKIPFVNFNQTCECGKNILTIKNLCNTINRKHVLKDFSSHSERTQIAFVGRIIWQRHPLSNLAGEID
jgi:hypothetical protein